MLTHEPVVRKITAAFTPDPDDAFAWWALATRQLTVNGCDFDIKPMHIQDINRGCIKEVIEIGAVSSAVWPLIHKNYMMLSAGASVGRNYGPALVAKKESPDPSAGTRVAIPGIHTTGALLLKLFFPGVQTIEMPFDKIAAAVCRGEVQAGVLIHEELLNWKAIGLRRVCCLGQRWSQETQLPIPVGLNVIHKRLGMELITRIGNAIRESMRIASRKHAEAYPWAMTFSREAEAGIGGQFINMFANEDTLELAPECLTAMNKLYTMAFERGLISEIPPVNPI